MPLAPAYELNDFDLGSGVERGGCPEATPDDSAVEFDGYAFRFETQGLYDLFERCFRGENVAFAIDSNAILP
jgi:hypothetical protein